MRVAHISHTNGRSGSGIAVRRINEALNQNLEIKKSFLLVNRKYDADQNTICPNNKITNKYQMSKLYFERILVKLIKYNDSNFHSLSCLPSKLDQEINKLNAEVINLHWVQHEMISIESIGKIKKPIIWTLHDSWAFSSTEHYPYNNENKQNLIPRFIDNWCMQRKVNSWKNEFTIVCPSLWLANIAKKSNLMKNWNINVIPNPVNINKFYPKDKKNARRQLNIPLKSKVIAYGAIDGLLDLRKGGDLLLKTLEKIDASNINLTIIIFGKEKKLKIKNSRIKFINLGLIFDEDKLALIYSAADLMIVPSRQESFGQTASEAMSCGTPVIAYKTSGLIDIINNNENGILIDPFDHNQMAKTIIQVLNQKEKLLELGENARNKALKEWSYKIISEKYKNIYLSVLDK